MPYLDPEKAKAAHRAYHQRNRDKLNARRNELRKLAYQADPAAEKEKMRARGKAYRSYLALRELAEIKARKL